MVEWPIQHPYYLLDEFTRLHKVGGYYHIHLGNRLVVKMEVKNDLDGVDYGLKMRLVNEFDYLFNRHAPWKLKRRFRKAP
jgi:hypothetical protein